MHWDFVNEISMRVGRCTRVALALQVKIWSKTVAPPQYSTSLRMRTTNASLLSSYQSALAMFFRRIPVEEVLRAEGDQIQCARDNVQVAAYVDFTIALESLDTLTSSNVSRLYIHAQTPPTFWLIKKAPTTSIVGA
jgi:hypothetical protein